MRFTVPAFYQWHFLNAFSDGNTVVADYIHEADASSLSDFVGVQDMAFEEPRMLGAGRLHRATIDLTTKAFSAEPLSPTIAEFPMIRPRDAGARHRQGWIHIERYHDGLLEFGIGRVTDAGVEERWLERGQMSGEHVFVPHGDDGCLLSLVYDGGTDQSHWLLSNARTLDPVAQVALPHPVPVTFHGSWSPTTA